MIKILAIETSSDACSVAVSDGHSDYSFHELMPRQHTESLLSVIDDLLNSASLDIKSLDVVAVGCGPGSFTGIRLACSTAQGISISQNIRGIVVPSLHLLASSVNRSESAKKIVSIVDANMDRLYLGEYSYSDERLKSSELTSIPINAFNPKKYDGESIQKFRRKEIKVKEIWENDKNIINGMKAQGYKVLVVWESELKDELEKITKKILKFAKSWINY